MSLHDILDEAIAEKAVKSWKDGRLNGFGCSDLGALWIILGYVSEHDLNDYREVHGQKEYVTPRYMVEQAKPWRRTPIPRLIYEKAQLPNGPKRKDSDAQAEGKHKERSLFDSSRLGKFGTKAVYGPDASLDLLPSTWRDRVVSNEDEPIVIQDSVEPRLRCTIEAWEYTPKGLIAWELKTDRNGIRTKPPWYQRLQALGEAIVLDADAWGIQYGPRWALADEPSFPDLPDPVQWGPFAVRPEDKQMIRSAVAAGWRLVEEARGGGDE